MTGTNSAVKEQTQNSTWKGAKGHELPLASFIKNKKAAVITLMKGHVLIGQVTGFDRYTVTLGAYTAHDNDLELLHSRPGPVTIFKHAISTFEGAAQ